MECPGGRPEILVVRSSPEGQFFLNQALRQGGKILYRDRGLFIVFWPTPLHRFDRVLIRPSEAARFDQPARFRHEE